MKILCFKFVDGNRASNDIFVLNLHDQFILEEDCININGREPVMQVEKRDLEVTNGIME